MLDEVLCRIRRVVFGVSLWQHGKRQEFLEALHVLVLFSRSIVDLATITLQIYMFLMSISCQYNI
jgi:hypothetical protein